MASFTGQMQHGADAATDVHDRARGHDQLLVEAIAGRVVRIPGVQQVIQGGSVGVFTSVPFAGNGLIVLFGGTASVRAEALISVTGEMRQFELILADCQPGAGRVTARIFTAEEELPFAGHPVIGAAAALHERH
jgi:hypothetical protein